MAIARQRGVRTVNVVRRAEVVPELTVAGGDVVLVDGPDLDGRVAQATAGARIVLGLDGVGGESTASLASCLVEGATVVCYATAKQAVLVVPALQVIFARTRRRSPTPAGAMAESSSHSHRASRWMPDRHRVGQDAAIHEALERRVREVITTCDVRTTASLAHQVPDWVQEIADVLRRHIMDALERRQSWPRESVVADQAAHDCPVPLFDRTGGILQIGPRAGEANAVIGAVVQQGRAPVAGNRSRMAWHPPMVRRK
jgi:hypothetical protein